MNEIHHTCIIDEKVNLGTGNKILPYTIIYGPTNIGNNNTIGPNVIIGTPGEDSKDPWYDSSNSLIEIGDNNIIREFSVIQKPCVKEITKIGNNVFLMHGVHIPHDAIIYDKVIVTPMCILGGITTLLEGANIGIGSSIHQNTVVGQYSMIAMGSTLTKNVRPFTIYVKDKKPKVNLYAVKKYSFVEFLPEITEYVESGIMPKSEEVAKLVNQFELLHENSERKLFV